MGRMAHTRILLPSDCELCQHSVCQTRVLEQLKGSLGVVISMPKNIHPFTRQTIVRSGRKLPFDRQPNGNEGWIMDPGLSIVDKNTHLGSRLCSRIGRSRALVSPCQYFRQPENSGPYPRVSLPSCSRVKAEREVMQKRETHVRTSSTR